MGFVVRREKRDMSVLYFKVLISRRLQEREQRACMCVCVTCVVCSVCVCVYVLTASFFFAVIFIN